MCKEATWCTKSSCSRSSNRVLGFKIRGLITARATASQPAREPAPDCTTAHLAVVQSKTAQQLPGSMPFLQSSPYLLQFHMQHSPQSTTIHHTWRHVLHCSLGCTHALPHSNITLTRIEKCRTPMSQPMMVSGMGQATQIHRPSNQHPL